MCTVRAPHARRAAPPALTRARAPRVLLGPSADTLALNSGGPLSLLMPPPTQRAAQLTGGACGLPSALTKRRRGGRLPVAFALDDPQQGLSGEAAGGGEAEEEVRRCRAQADCAHSD